MTIWVDAHLSPRIARWLTDAFGVSAVPLREMGLRDAGDDEIFQAARKAGAVVMTKDSDFQILQQRFSPPPQLIWLTCGNTSDARLRVILTMHFAEVMRLLESGEAIVELTGL